MHQNYLKTQSRRELQTPCFVISTSLFCSKLILGLPKVNATDRKYQWFNTIRFRVRERIRSFTKIRFKLHNCTWSLQLHKGGVKVHEYWWTEAIALICKKLQLTNLEKVMLLSRYRSYISSCCEACWRNWKAKPTSTSTRLIARWCPNFVVDDTITWNMGVGRKGH